MLKVVIFGIIVFGCYFVSAQNAPFTCFVNDDLTAFPTNSSNTCNYCGYNELSRVVGVSQCDSAPEGAYYTCLSEPKIVYGENKAIFNTTNAQTCTRITIGCINYDLYICQNDNCNGGCTPAPTLSPTTTAPTTTLAPTTTPAIATTTIGNSNAVSATTLSIYGLFLSAFISVLLH